MTPQDITLLLGAFGIFIGILGGGGKWLLSHIAANAAISEAREEKARNDLSLRMREEIDALRGELAKVLSEKSLYLKRIYQLEYFIHKQPGVEIPDMEGWPPV